MLIYGHYDVQPADPLSEWRSLPFSPIVRNGNIYARGASDNKGQLFCHVKGLEALLRTTGRLPVNVICLFEGEEEIGSPNLPAWLKSHQAEVHADIALISDTRFLARNRPAITYGLRGGLGIELTVRGPKQDVHSGAFGGAVHNPIQVLCEIIAHLHDRQGRIAIPGIYRQVRHWNEQERRQMALAAPSNRQILRGAGVQLGWGDRGFSAYERTTIRPALTINGITGGYQDKGGKGVIPAQASAKISLRLVPDQDPDQIDRLLRRQIARLTPASVESHVITQMKSRPVLLNRRHPAMQAAVRAYSRGFGVAPVFLRSGGSIPVVNTFYEVLGIPTVLMGFALPDDRAHAPNEKFSLSQLKRGIETSIHFLNEIGKMERHHHLRFANRNSL